MQGEAEYVIDIENQKILNSSKLAHFDDSPPSPLKAPYYSLYIEITCGCPHNCFFCQTTEIFGSKPRHRSIKSILKYCEILLKNNLTDLRFAPNDFSYGSVNGIKLNFETLENLLKLLNILVKNKGRIFFGSFPAEVRPEYVNEDTIGLIKKYCSNKKIIIGAQSGSDRILKLLNRKHTVEDVIKAIKIAIKFNLTPHIDIISGFPFETKKDIFDTIKFLENSINIGCKIHMHKFIPLPGTKFKNLSPVPYFPDLKNFLNKWQGKGIVWGNF